LIQHYGDVPWIHQAVDAMKFSLDRVVKHLISTPGVETNAAGSMAAPQTYRMPARTAAEAKAQIAEEAAVSPQNSQAVADPAAQLQRRNPRRWRDELAKRQQPPPELPHAEPERTDDGEVSWLL
jgi:hypothetical protein